MYEYRYYAAIQRCYINIPCYSNGTPNYASAGPV